MKFFQSKVSFCLVAFLCLCACKQDAKVWIVMDFVTKDGQPAQMAFDNPSLPDITMAECEESLQDATQNLLAFTKNEPNLAEAEFVGSKCVQSNEDPIKPKA